MLPQYRDWEIVVGFYAALHLLQAYLSTKDPRFQAARHEDRMTAIKSSPELRKSSGDIERFADSRQDRCLGSVC
jgi:hypothetical protein